ncbi:MAG TPA: DinB family protein [Phycisphaerales bacterium]|nr:DinB family protein [Phycisphaerales bacterium]
MPSTPADSALLVSFWNDAWEEGLWAAGWRRSLDGLTAAQAAWSPPNAPGVPGRRHSIWQNVLHLCFWREDALRRLGDDTKADEATVAAVNFPAVTDTSEEAWAATRARFAESQRRVGEALARPGTDTSRLRYMLPHDCYHMGQINLIRAMLGLAPIE